MKYSPKNQKKQASVIAWACLFCAAVAYGFSISGIVSPLPLQLIMVIALCAAAYILVRYIYTSVTYEIRPKSPSADGSLAGLYPREVDLAVHRAQGKRENLEFLMSLDCLRETQRVEDGTLASLKKKYGRDMKVYYYTVDMVPEERLAAVFEDDSDMYCIVIAREEKIEAYLREVCLVNAESAEERT